MKDLADGEALWDWYEETQEQTCVVQPANGELLLIFSTEDGDLCYQGVPFEDAEDGSSVDKNVGMVERLDDNRWPMKPIWPVTS